MPNWKGSSPLYYFSIFLIYGRKSTGIASQMFENIVGKNTSASSHWKEYWAILYKYDISTEERSVLSKKMLRLRVLLFLASAEAISTGNSSSTRSISKFSGIVRQILQFFFDCHWLCTPLISNFTGNINIFFLLKNYIWKE